MKSLIINRGFEMLSETLGKWAREVSAHRAAQAKRVYPNEWWNLALLLEIGLLSVVFGILVALIGLTRVFERVLRVN